jgi:RNA polymerase sigma-70 factor (ECF subfamily)
LSVTRVKPFGGLTTGAERGSADTLLFERLASGDETALDELYARYERPVFELGIRLLGDRELAAELVQETFLRLWRTADRFDASRGAVATYVFTVARHLAVDLWRRPSSRPLEPEPGERAAVIGDATDDMLTRVVVDEALATLSRPHREVVVLSYCADLTQPAIAQILGVPLGTVKTRSYHALRALKAALMERGIGVDSLRSAP